MDQYPRNRLPDPQFRSKPLRPRSAQPERLLIRDDGMVVGWNPRLIQKSNFRLYTGPVPCSIEDGLKWLYGDAGKADLEAGPEPEVFDPLTARKGLLLKYAKEQFDKTLDQRMSVEPLRAEVMALIEAREALK